MDKLLSRFREVWRARERAGRSVAQFAPVTTRYMRRDKLDNLIIAYQERVLSATGVELSRSEAVARLVAYRPDLADVLDGEGADPPDTPIGTIRDAEANGTPKWHGVIKGATCWQNARWHRVSHEITEF